MTTRAIINAAIAAGVSAALVDVHAFVRTEGKAPFNWRLCLARVIAGVLTGVMTSMGVAAIP